MKVARDRKEQSPVRNLSEAVFFTGASSLFRNVNYLSCLQTHSALSGSHPGRRLKNKFPLTRMFTIFFPQSSDLFSGRSR